MVSPIVTPSPEISGEISLGVEVEAAREEADEE
jgi:hypothetical protein